MNVAYYTTASGRQPAQDFVDKLDNQSYAAQIRADIHEVAQRQRKAAASIKPVTAYSPMWEIRTGNYRTFFYFAAAEDMVVVLHTCKKEDQKQGIKLAYKRMMELTEA